MALANTGFKGYLKLVKVTNDGTLRPLDINNQLVSASGLLQDIKDNLISDANYIAPIQDLISCPIPIPDNVAPVAVNDVIYTTKNTPVTHDVTTNDYDSDGITNKATVNLDVTSNTIVNSVSKTEGLWTVNNLGVVTFTPALDFVGTATINYNLKDNLGLVSNNATITAQVDSGIVIFDTDYLVLSYNFIDGRDLDTRTRIVTPNIGQDAQAEYVGWGVMSSFPALNPIITFGGDNLGILLETVLIDIEKLKSLYPGEDTIVVDCRAFWHIQGNLVGLEPVNMKANFYKGGTMIAGTPLFGFSNPTAINSLEFYTSGTIIPGPMRNDASFSGYRICTFTYTISTATGIFNTSDTTTPSI